MALASVSRQSHTRVASTAQRCVRTRTPVLRVLCSQKLILYTKRDCPLCQGLQEKLEAIMSRATFLPSPLSSLILETRDINTNPEWLAAFEMEVPIMALVKESGEQIIIPRITPRTSADKLQKHIEQIIAALA